MLRPFSRMMPLGKVRTDLSFSSGGSTLRSMSECMSVISRSGRPSRSWSKDLIPIAPQDVLGKCRAVRSSNFFPSTFTQ